MRPLKPPETPPARVACIQPSQAFQAPFRLGSVVMGIATAWISTARVLALFQGLWFSVLRPRLSQVATPLDTHSELRSQNSNFHRPCQFSSTHAGPLSRWECGPEIFGNHMNRLKRSHQPQGAKHPLALDATTSSPVRAASSSATW